MTEAPACGIPVLACPIGRIDPAADVGAARGLGQHGATEPNRADAGAAVDSGAVRVRRGDVHGCVAAGRYARLVLPVVQGAGTPPNLDASDLEGSRQRFHTYLHNQVDALNTALTQIAAAGPAPVDKGAQVDQVLVTTLSRQRDELAAGLAELDAVPQRQPETLRYTLTAVTSLIVPTDGRTLMRLAIPINLQPVARQAPSCQTLDASEGATGLR